MTDVMLPNIDPNSMDWGIDGVGAINQSPLNNAIQTRSRVGDAWNCSLDYRKITEGDRQELVAYIAELRGVVGRSFIRNHSHQVRGTFPTSELSPNVNFDSSVSPWTGTLAALSVNGRRLKIRNTTAAIGQARSGALTTINGAGYVFRVMCITGSTTSWILRAGTTAGGSEYIASTETTAGLKTFRFTTTGTTLHLTVMCNSIVLGDFVFADFITCARAMRVNGAAQTGSSLTISDAAGIADGELLRGDFVEVLKTTSSIEVGELKRLTQDFDRQTSSPEILFFEPPLRGAPADNSGVIVFNPLMKGVLVNDDLTWSTKPPGFISRVGLDFIEDV